MKNKGNKQRNLFFLSKIITITLKQKLIEMKNKENHHNKKSSLASFNTNQRITDLDLPTWPGVKSAPLSKNDIPALSLTGFL